MGVVPACGGQAFPPARPREVNKILGDTPRPPSEGACPLCTPPGLCQVILLMTIRLGRRARCPPHESHALRGLCFVAGCLWGVGRDGRRRRGRRNMDVSLPTRPPRKVNKILGDTPRPPAERDSPSLHSPFTSPFPVGDSGLSGKRDPEDERTWRAKALPYIR